MNSAISPDACHTRWHPDDLGKPIPGSIHSVSMALPTWKDVDGYESKSPDVWNRLSTGYPRFVYHPLVKEIGRELAGAAPCVPFPSRNSADECARFVARQIPGAKTDVISRRGMHGVCTEAGSAEDAVKAFWQHAGLTVSSRQAESWLSGSTNAIADGDEVRRALRQTLAEFYDCEPDHVFLCPTGMAAHYAALRILQARRPGLPTAQFGFPYVDTLKLQQKLGAGGILLHDLDSLTADLRALLENQPVAGCFCEIPGNPLLGSANLAEIRPVLREKRIPLVLDDVVATPFNIDSNRYADLVGTSLTKFIAGTGDVMGGALICNPRSPFFDQLIGLARTAHEDLLWAGDADVLQRGARDFPERMRRHNATGLLLAERLRDHPAIEKVWYPKWEFSEAYEAVRRPGGGWSALITFLPRDAERQSSRIYDALELCKGPSLGTVFTLVCPFTFLAHYTELDWAESCGVSRYLLRISAGLENPEEIWSKLEKVLG